MVQVAGAYRRRQRQWVVLSQMNMAYLMCLVTLGNGVRIWYSSDQEDKVLRGGDWSDRIGTLRVGFRNNYAPASGNAFYGFRCVADLP